MKYINYKIQTDYDRKTDRQGTYNPQFAQARFSVLSFKTRQETTMLRDYSFQFFYREFYAYQFCFPNVHILYPGFILDWISYFSLLQIREETFSGLSNLNRLDLRYNNITELSDSVLWEMSDLTVLYLRGNQITSLPTEIFIYSNRLQILDLGLNLLRCVCDLFDIFDRKWRWMDAKCVPRRWGRKLNLRKAKRGELCGGS